MTPLFVLGRPGRKATDFTRNGVRGRQLYAERRRDQLCVDCSDPTDGHVRCSAHRAANIQAQRDLAAERIAAGRCRECPAIAEPDGTRSAACRKRRAARPSRQREYRAVRER